MSKGNLDYIKRMHKAGRLLSEATIIPNWKYVDVPEDFLCSWKEYVEARTKFIEVLIQYGFIKDKTEF